MPNSTTLLPILAVLSTDNAVEAILGDIPLFCEGIMGIGVFTFLFLTKQVKLLAVFLYGSCFAVFVAATLDLGQVLARGPQNTATGLSLGSISAFIYGREAFLSISIFFLDLFFWTLVARCPRGECAEQPNELSTRGRLLSNHSASWNRWGLMGTILKWGTLAALISVPLLQMLWRLMPTQRRYSSIYVADSTIQTSVTAIFILKFLLNVSISPLDHWWHALQLYSVPIAALAIGIGLSIGNLTVFAFTETALGRFLGAVEVYLLILHSLYTTFQDFSATSQPIGSETSHLPSEKVQPEKSQSQYTGGLPFISPNASTNHIVPTASFAQVTPRPPIPPRVSTLSWVLPPPPRKRSDGPAQPPIDDPNAALVSPFPSPFGNASPLKESLDQIRPQREDDASTQQLQNLQSIERESMNSERPMTTVSLSYYTVEPNFPQARTQDPFEPFSLKHPVGSQQASITSIDELLRQQTELDKSIAALRLVSMSISSIPNGTDKRSVSDETSTATQANRSRTTVMSSKTESISNRSDFSLSVFPDPPVAPEEEVATKYPVEVVRKSEGQVSSAQKTKKDMRELSNIPTPGDSSVKGQSLQSQPNPPHAQYDVTSFIGDLSESSRNSFTSDSEEMADISTDLVAPGTGLRPMLLPSMISTSPSETGPLSAAPSYDSERPSLSTTETTKSLRPLLLGQPPSSRMVPQQYSVTKVPLAQRRQRGGTISSNTRRPVIGLPRMSEDTTDEESIFERPRPPPLRSNEQIRPM